MEDFESKKYLPGKLREAHYATFRGWTRQAHHPDASLVLGLCQPPSEAIIASASFGPQLPRL
jgi:hypothetical protein